MLPYEQRFFQAGKGEKPSSMRVHVTPTSKRQLSSVPLVAQETLGTSYQKIKKIGLISESTALHASHFFVHFLTVLHDNVMKMTNFAFYGERKQTTIKFYFL